MKTLTSGATPLEHAKTLVDGITDVPSGKLAVVVTSLEMFTPPPRRSEPAILPWKLRREERPGIDWFRDLFHRVGQDWLWHSRLELSDDALAAVIHDPSIEIYAMALEDRDEGLLELDFRQEGICELSFFGLTPMLIGKGAGRWLMNRAIEIAWARPIRRFWVHTCSLDHPGALAFYGRSGFLPFRRQIEISRDPRLDGTLPRSAAPGVPII